MTVKGESIRTEARHKSVEDFEHNSPIKYVAPHGRRIGTPCLCGGGLTLTSLASPGLFSSSSIFSPSSTLWPRERKLLLSLTGLRLGPPGKLAPGIPLTLIRCGPAPGRTGGPSPGELAVLPLGGDAAERWGMFSGRGCSEPMEVTPVSLALPALERA